MRQGCLTLVLLLLTVAIVPALAQTTVPAPAPPAGYPAATPPATPGAGSMPPATAPALPAGDFGVDSFGGQFGADPLGGGLMGGVPAPVTVTAEFTTAKGGQPARLFVTATMDPQYHIYSITQQAGAATPTKIKPTPSAAFRVTGDFTATTAPKKKPDEFEPEITIESHYGTVVWHAPIELAAGVDPATLTIEGTIYAQPCTETSCLMPQDFPFTASLGQGVAVTAAKSDPTTVAEEPAPAAKPIDTKKLATTLAFAFLGGLILNLMPCVLPVISLKVLSFIEQAGESRSRVFTLNLWYALGLFSVFMILAALAATAGLAWGEQFTLPWFKVAMTGLVFVMALSFLGVWEIPIPGFVGSGKAGEMQAREGLDGAFSKGVFTTIMATPCSGPFLGPVFGFLLEQPPYMAYWVFGAVGLGMASPYLVIGAFPALLKFLPRPGAWMETFKQIMAFLLLGTVVYLFTTLSPKFFIPTLTLLVGLWFACWWIGRTPMTATFEKRMTAWIGGGLVAALVGAFAFTVLLYESKMPWKPFSPAELAQARSEGKTVMVDFTANWCPTCKYNLKVAVDTEDVRKLVDENDVVPMLADWTDKSPVIKKALNDLGRQSIPVLAIWPAGASDDGVIVLDDLLSQAQVLEALEEAGPSKPVEGGEGVAVRPRGPTR